MNTRNHEKWDAAISEALKAVQNIIHEMNTLYEAETSQAASRKLVDACLHCQTAKARLEDVATISKELEGRK